MPVAVAKGNCAFPNNPWRSRRRRGGSGTFPVHAVCTTSPKISSSNPFLKFNPISEKEMFAFDLFTGGRRPQFCTIGGKYTMFTILLCMVNLREFTLFERFPSSGVLFKHSLCIERRLVVSQLMKTIYLPSHYVSAS